jgi:hypothetical protein
MFNPGSLVNFLFCKHLFKLFRRFPPPPTPSNYSFLCYLSASVVIHILSLKCISLIRITLRSIYEQLYSPDLWISL